MHSKVTPPHSNVLTLNNMKYFYSETAVSISSSELNQDDHCVSNILLFLE